MAYSIWLEFEQYVDYDPKDADEFDDGYCNVMVTYDDGRQHGYNVWTLKHFRDNIQIILNQVETEGFATMPDIIVSRLEREHIIEVLSQVLAQ